MSDTPILLITGAAGRVGSFYRQHLRDRQHGYQLRLSDIKPPPDNEDYREGVWHSGNLADPDFANHLLQGVHTVLHLAADPSPDADFYASLLDNNFKSTYNVFAAAFAARARKVIYASSGQAVIGYPDAVQIKPDMATRPLNMYGVSKAFGEATAAYFAYAHGLPALCVRIGWVVSHDELRRWPDSNPYDLSRAVTEQDLSHMFDCCLRTNAIQYAILHAVSNNHFRRLDLTQTQQLVGYQPQDDAFAISGVLPPQRISSDTVNILAQVDKIEN